MHVRAHCEAKFRATQAVIIEGVESHLIGAECHFRFSFGRDYLSVSASTMASVAWQRSALSDRMIARHWSIFLASGSGSETIAREQLPASMFWRRNPSAESVPQRNSE